MESLVHLPPSGSNTLLACLVAMLINSALGSGRGLSERATAQIQRPNAPYEFLGAHNRDRAAVHVGPLKWSQKLAKEASQLVTYQRDRKSCQFADLSSTEYGANQVWSVYNRSPHHAVDMWVKEGQFSNHAKNSCATNVVSILRWCGTQLQSLGVLKPVVSRASLPTA